jgi:hypothetical protein
MKIRYIILALFTIAQTLSAQMSIEKLDEVALFSFAIMSDNKGASIENVDMYKCDKWIRESNDRFILGLGDHVKDNRINPFLNFIKKDSLWHNHFYPNVADGENEFWGMNQADWGAGAPILNWAGLYYRQNVKVRENKCEYYAVETYDGIKVHIIQLHFSDSPKDPDLAFNESSRKYLMDVLNSIKKTKKDIIVVLAHTGPWFNLLSDERRSVLIKKADLLLGATTHRYKRYKISDDKNAKVALALNTGAVGNSNKSGYIQVHVLNKPLRMVVQYQLLNNGSRELQKEGYAYQKIIKGKVESIDWNTFK